MWLALIALAHAEDWKLTGSGLRASTVFASTQYVDVGTLTTHKRIYKVQCAALKSGNTCRFVDQSTSPLPTYTTSHVTVSGERFTIRALEAEGFCEDWTMPE